MGGWFLLEGCPSDLTLKSGGPITFDSRSGVSSLAQVRFWVFYGFFRWIGGREVVETNWSFRKMICGCCLALVFRTRSFILRGVFSKGVSSDDVWLDIVFTMVVFSVFSQFHRSLFVLSRDLDVFITKCESANPQGYKVPKFSNESGESTIEHVTRQWMWRNCKWWIS